MRQRFICVRNDFSKLTMFITVTNTPHPPSSSTQATSTQNTATTEESENTALSGSQYEKDSLRVADEAPEVPKKNRGLLPVPSRSSSHKIQPSPTTTGLSGATVSDPADSIGGVSKESKGSILGRRRNGSATSSKMSITQQGTSAGPTGTANNAASNPTISRQPKKKGLFSFLCCGVPDSANPADPNAKGSILGRRRNGSATSSKMSITQQGTSAGPTGTANNAASNPTISRQPKKKGLFSFLCCGVPDSANPADPNDAAVPANKVTKVPSARPATASRPDQGIPVLANNDSTKPQTEKEALRQDAQQSGSDKEGSDIKTSAGRTLPMGGAIPPAANGDLNQTETDTRDQALPELSKETEDSTSAGQTTNPAVVVQGPSRSESKISTIQNTAQEQKDTEGNTKMGDSGSVPADKEESPAPAVRKDETVNKAALPPPPPVPQPQPGPSEDPAAPEPAEQKSQWLLPPIAPRFQGKKCLVLDLDETLVHSSFKVCFLRYTAFNC